MLSSTSGYSPSYESKKKKKKPKIKLKKKKKSLGVQQTFHTGKLHLLYKKISFILSHVTQLLEQLNIPG